MSTLTFTQEELETEEMNPTVGHVSVLLKEAVEYLEIKEDDVVVDATLGGAGHFSALLSGLGSEGVLIGIDADSDAIERARVAQNASNSSARVHLALNNFRNLAAVVQDAQVTHIDKILFDLGWSSFHLSRGRGFSFQVDEPLLMTYGAPEEGKTAADVVNTATEETLSDLIFTLGEERFARQIARGIVRARTHKRILTTADLVEVVKESTPAWYHHRRINPATKTFQALRMYVNDELGALREGLDAAVAHLAPHGRIAVITFHSIEDRVVKNYFRDLAHAGQGTLITRKPLPPSAEECARNPRARSAKLRVFERTPLV